MRALLTPEIAPRMGIVLFRPGSELMPLFMQGRVLLEPEPERYSSFASGAVPAASQPLADDPAVRAVFRNEAVIRRAGGVECLESWLLREKGCQWPHSDWHSGEHDNNATRAGAQSVCGWHCD
ncbi:putative prophage protein [Escherichia coli]|uniref:Putative prophage protein n=1 Tax=Escherichia coli TaxID=562 RepID=A0A2X3KNW4_ECOLX|nr:putative prophage protein [Escherichia coli]